MSLVRSMYVSLCKEVIDITGKKIKRKGVIVLTCFLKCSLRVELCYENKKKTNLKLYFDFCGDGAIFLLF